MGLAVTSCSHKRLHRVGVGQNKVFGNARFLQCLVRLLVQGILVGRFLAKYSEPLV